MTTALVPTVMFRDHVLSWRGAPGHLVWEYAFNVPQSSVSSFDDIQGFEQSLLELVTRRSWRENGLAHTKSRFSHVITSLPVPEHWQPWAWIMVGPWLIGRAKSQYVAVFKYPESYIPPPGPVDFGRGVIFRSSDLAVLQTWLRESLQVHYRQVLKDELRDEVSRAVEALVRTAPYPQWCLCADPNDTRMRRRANDCHFPDHNDAPLHFFGDYEFGCTCPS